MKEFKGYRKGVNLGGWLSQCDYTKEHMDSFITEADFKAISELGADHVRIPFDYNILEDDEGTFKESGFKYIDGALELCEKYHLNAVLDLHKAAGFSFDKGEMENGFFESERLQERFYCLWEEMAFRYGHLHERTAFELLNEVTEQRYGKIWNGIVSKCVSRIRVLAPKTVILVGSYWNNSPAAVKDLDAPYDDRIVYNCHCYDPLVYTHQGAGWVDSIDSAARIDYEQSGWSREKFAEAFSEAIRFAEAHNTSLYCGEYGVIDRAAPEDALKWFKDINSVFEEYNISRCAWSCKGMDFGLLDKRMENVLPELKNYL